jgi:hypothetical protein
MPQLDVIDCSSNQPPALEACGYDEAITAGAWCAFEKATSYEGRGGRPYTNPYFARRRMIIAQKFRCGGAYIWVSPNIPAVLQVAHFINVVGDLGREGIQVDSEQAGVTNQMTIDVTNLLYARYGARILVYANLARLNAIKDHLPDDVYFWLPWYDDPWWVIEHAIQAVGLADRIVVWQWGGGRQGVFLPSLGARVDSNYVLNPVVFRRICGLADPVPVPVPTHVEDDLMVVILAPRGANARFLAVMGKTASGAQVAVHAEWLRSEDEMRPFLNNGVQVVECDATDLVNVSVDAVPVGDVVSWTSANFRRVAA